MPSKEEIITPSYIEDLKKRIANLEEVYNNQHSESMNGDYPKGECHGKVENCTAQPNPRITSASITVPSKESMIIPGIYGTIKEAVNNLEANYSNNCCQSYHCQTCQQECKDIECDDIECEDVKCKDQCDGGSQYIDDNDIDTWTPGTPGEYYGNTGPIFIGGCNLFGSTTYINMGNDWWIRIDKPPKDFNASNLVERFGEQLQRGDDSQLYSTMFQWGAKRLNHYLKYHYNTTPHLRKSRAYNSGSGLERADQAIVEYTIKHPIPYFDTGIEEGNSANLHDQYKSTFVRGYYGLSTSSIDVPTAVIVYPGSKVINSASGARPAVYSKYNDIATGDAYPFWYQYGTVVHNNFDYDAPTYTVDESNGYWYKWSGVRLGKLKDVKDKDYADLTSHNLRVLKWFTEGSADAITYEDYPYIEGMAEEEARQAFENEDWYLTIIMFQKNANDTIGMRALCAREAFKSENGIQYAPLSFCVSYWDGGYEPPMLSFSNSEYEGRYVPTAERGIKYIDIPGVPSHITCGEVIELQDSLQNVKRDGKVTIHMWQDNE